MSLKLEKANFACYNIYVECNFTLYCRNNKRKIFYKLKHLAAQRDNSKSSNKRENFYEMKGLQYIYKLKK